MKRTTLSYLLPALLMLGFLYTSRADEVLASHVSAFIPVEENNGRENLLWRHKDGRLAVWEMDGTNRVANYLLNNGKPGV